MAFPLCSYLQEMCMTYGVKFPFQDSCKGNGISSRFSLLDTQVIGDYCNWLKCHHYYRWTTGWQQAAVTETDYYKKL